MKALCALLFVLSAPAAASPSIFFLRQDRVCSMAVDGSRARDLGIVDDNPFTFHTWLSPDRAWIAFHHGGEAWVAQSDGGKKTRVTSFARNPRGKYAGQLVQIHGWSPDSKSVVFQVDIELDPMTDNAPIRPNAPLGLYAYSRESKQTRRISSQLPNFYQASSDLAVVRASPFRVLYSAWYSSKEDDHSKVFLVDATTAKERTVVRVNGSAGQQDVLGDEFALTTIDGIGRFSAEGQLTAQVIYGEFAEYQYPRYSPDEKLLAFVHHKNDMEQIMLVPRRGGDPQKLPAVCRMRCDYQWLDDENIVYVDASTLKIYNLQTGKTRALGPATGLVRWQP